MNTEKEERMKKIYGQLFYEMNLWMEEGFDECKTEEELCYLINTYWPGCSPEEKQRIITKWLDQRT